MSKLFLTSPIVTVDWLNDNLNAENLVVLDGTINKTFDVNSNQIPKARFFDIKKKFSDVTNPFPSAFPASNLFQKEARTLGINNDSAIVIYDDKGIYSSARVWWLFKALGYTNVAVLNGGFPFWQDKGYVVEKMTKHQVELGDFTVNLQDNHMRFFDDVQEASQKRTYQIIDARSKARFNCLVPEPREGLRMGTIPNSINIPYTDLLNGNILKDKEELKNIFENTIKDKPVIFSCGSGITACIMALGATLCGYKNVSVYDGSWTEWGSLVKN